MQKKLLSFLLLTIFFSAVSNGQFTRYIVRFTNKGGNSFSIANPSAYLSSRALDRRTRYTISIDSSDLPVTASYVNAVKNIPNVTVLNTSKWLNAISIQTTDANAITAIQALPFVLSTAGLAARTNVEIPAEHRDKFQLESIETALPPSTGKLEGTAGDYYDYGTAATAEIKLHHGEFLHNIGLRGQGMRVAVLDGGFYNYTTLRSFDSINANGQVLNTWDFVAGNASVTEDHQHGMQCLSTIAANIPGQFIGKAPKASFYLFRTEDVNSEYPIEEFNWVCGAERADSAGADIISSSLGYYDFDNAVFNYTYSQMNGNTTLSVKGADLGAKKGLLIFNAVGNEGNNAWKFLITPSDGDSIVAVGAVNSSGVTGSFSSYGPSADGRVKPEISSIGVSAVVQGTSNTIVTANGTSFATPNMAGLSTCLWQAFPEFNNMRILKALKESSTQFNSPDTRQGYGIPNMKSAFINLLKDYVSASGTINACKVSLQWNSKDVNAMYYDIERILPGETNFTKVKSVSGKGGNILSAQSYTFNDTLSNIAAGFVTYRIKQYVDTAALSMSFIYIDTINLNITGGCYTTIGPEGISLRPNPFTNGISQLYINFADAMPNLSINVFNKSGQSVKKWSINKPAGEMLTPFDLQNESAGVYFIKVYSGNKYLATLKAVKL